MSTELWVQYPVVFGILCLWVGLVFSISFLETPLKFSSPGMEKVVALQLGKKMFRVSTNIQLFFMVIVASALIYHFKTFPQRGMILLGTIFFILLCEKIWMLPILNKQIDKVSQGGKISSPTLHFIFVGAEIIKLLLVIITALQLIQKIKL